MTKFFVRDEAHNGESSRKRVKRRDLIIERTARPELVRPLYN